MTVANVYWLVGFMVLKNLIIPLGSTWLRRWLHFIPYVEPESTNQLTKDVIQLVKTYYFFPSSNILSILVVSLVGTFGYAFSAYWMHLLMESGWHPQVLWICIVAYFFTSLIHYKSDIHSAISFYAGHALC